MEKVRWKKKHFRQINHILTASNNLLRENDDSVCEHFDILYKRYVYTNMYK